MTRISYGSVTHNSVYAVLVEMNSASTYTEAYITCNGQTSPNLAYVGQSGNTTSKGHTFTGLSPSTTYTLYWTARTAISSGSGETSFVTSAAPQPPARPSWVSAYSSSNAGTMMYADWGAVSGATQYYVTIRQGNVNGSTLASKYVQAPTTTTSFTGLTEWTDYTITVSAMNANGTSDYNYSTAKTIDSIAPIFNYVITDSDGIMKISYSAYDNGSGMRPGSSYYVEISGRNNTTYGSGEYTTNLGKTFLADGAGNEFVHDSYYYMRVTAYDVSANARAEARQVQFKKTRPDNWEWDTTKTSGSALNITASEWNRFTIRINQFRTYKSLDNYTFTAAVSGSTMYASQFNQARTAISAMNSSVPSAQSSGGAITASSINALRNSLNAIT